MLLPTLAENGRPDLAYRVLLQTTSPSWLAEVERGATTIWETWEGTNRTGGPTARIITTRSAVWRSSSTSTSPASAPGYREVVVAPTIGGGLSAASSAVETPYCRARSAWKVQDGEVTLEVTVPVATSAKIHTPDGIVHRGSGEHLINYALADLAKTRAAA